MGQEVSVYTPPSVSSGEDTVSIGTVRHQSEIANTTCPRLKKIFAWVRQGLSRRGSPITSLTPLDSSQESGDLNLPTESAVADAQLYPSSMTRRLEPRPDEKIFLNEQVRDPAHQATVESRYAHNYEQITRYILETIDSAVLDPEVWYNDFFPTLHRKMADQGYLGVSGMPDFIRIPTGVYRDYENISTSLEPVGILENMFLAEVTDDVDQGSWPFPRRANQGDDLLSQGRRGEGTFFYPEHEYIQPALERVREHILAALQSDDQAEILDQIARANWFVRYHPFPLVNNSIFMALTNSVLEKKGMNKLPHLFLDIHSHWLAPDTYSRVFQWNYRNFAESPTDVSQANKSRVRLEGYLKWRKSMSEQFTDVEAIPPMEDGELIDAAGWLTETKNYQEPRIQSYPYSYKAFALLARAYFLQSGLGLP
ncbi:MAG: hypothetical protein COY80_01800 [Candidatus Pacebacteria bacterium CG_4_10_14_0_8_um_filter_42_14]|nr:MAG: hypothetical protein COY80_01800 [Candidatus Pacebacteria bacterium CG_4_10_14_0_8_um_filter_42_14]